VATALSAFFPYVLPHAAQCPIPLAEQAVRVAAMEFCRKTLLVHQIFKVDVTANAVDYTVTLPTDQKLTRVIKVLVGSKELASVPFSSITSAPALAGAAVGDAVVTPGPATCFFQKDTGVPSFSLYPVPYTTVTGGMVYVAAFEPTETAATVADLLFLHWAREIGYGALAHVLAVAGQPFSDPTLAAVYAGKFEAAKDVGISQMRKGQTTASLAVRPRKFA
jgi:hypothetical protein